MRVAYIAEERIVRGTGTRRAVVPRVADSKSWQCMIFNLIFDAFFRPHAPLAVKRVPCSVHCTPVNVQLPCVGAIVFRPNSVHACQNKRPASSTPSAQCRVCNVSQSRQSPERPWSRSWSNAQRGSYCLWVAIAIDVLSFFSNLHADCSYRSNSGRGLCHVDRLWCRACPRAPTHAPSACGRSAGHSGSTPAGACPS